MTEQNAVEDLLRTYAPQVLGVLTRRYGDFADAEDAVQDALLAAVSQWAAAGVPENPRAWLLTVAGRRLVDRMRADDARRRREEAVARNGHPRGEVPGQDDSLTLLFLCCHPSLSPSAAIPLTLRAVGVLTTAEIARALHVPESSLGTRISRAKQRIRQSGLRFTMPTSEEWDQRLRSVLHVLYLIFNEGYAASSGHGVARADLSGEAIRLTRGLHRQLPDNAEVAGLLSLMLLLDARRPARTGPAGQLIPLAEQDRSLWDADLRDEGLALVAATLARGTVGSYQLQAAIAAVHDEAETAEATDWPQILALYGLLERVVDNPFVTLNRAVAVAMVHGPRAGLKLLDTLDGALGGHHRLAATRAHLFEQVGDPAGARAHYLAAAGRTTSEAERVYLTERASAVSPAGNEAR